VSKGVYRLEESEVGAHATMPHRRERKSLTGFVGEKAEVVRSPN
jgi:hypothetical protein